MSVKFVVAKLSSQTLRGLCELCEALNFNEKLHFYLVTHNVRDTLKKSSSFRTLLRLHELAKHELHYDLSNAPSASDVASPSPQFQWCRSCLTMWRTQNSSAARIFPAPKEIRHSNDPNIPRGVHLYCSRRGKSAKSQKSLGPVSKKFEKSSTKGNLLLALGKHSKKSPQGVIQIQESKIIF